MTTTLPFVLISKVFVMGAIHLSQVHVAKLGNQLNHPPLREASRFLQNLLIADSATDCGLRSVRWRHPWRPVLVAGDAGGGTRSPHGEGV